MTSRRVFLAFVTCAGIGRLPFAPGTYASLLGCLLLYFFHPFSNPAVIAAFAVAAVYSISRLRPEQKDPGYIVIDELLGIFITMTWHEAGIVNLIKGFILFRTFDILKPYPIRKFEQLPGAYGIIADDIVAGIFANIVLVIWGKVV